MIVITKYIGNNPDFGLGSIEARIIKDGRIEYFSDIEELMTTLLTNKILMSNHINFIYNVLRDDYSLQITRHEYILSGGKIDL